MRSSIIIIICIIYIWNYTYNSEYSNIKKINMNDLLHLKKFKTGDIILYKSQHATRAPLIFSYFTHIGIVWVDSNNNPYVFEANSKAHIRCPNTTNDGELQINNMHGIQLCPLISRINRYGGIAFYKELLHKISDKKYIEFTKFIQYCMKNMIYEERIIWNFLKKSICGESIHHQINCGELVYLSLIKLGLLPTTHTNLSHHLKFISNIKYLNNNKYKLPKQIIVNSF